MCACPDKVSIMHIFRFCNRYFFNRILHSCKVVCHHNNACNEYIREIKTIFAVKSKQEREYIKNLSNDDVIE